ncbi:50S ribosomal protein L19 [Candidatus Giovannonibacteria bacterium]|nr:50S ribosomal protein L19 [Candidatus Giovannonibacteria bacterium]
MNPALNKNFSPIDIEGRKNLDMRPGDTVRVWQKIKEGDKMRLQAFEGLILARKHGNEPGATFTVRKVADGIGVERVFPVYSPAIDKIEILKRGRVRRAKLYYIREKAQSETRRKMKQVLYSAPKEEKPLEAPATE